MSDAPIWLWLLGAMSFTAAWLSVAFARGLKAHETRATRVLAWIVGMGAVAGWLWFVYADFIGYHHTTCMY